MWLIILVMEPKLLKIIKSLNKRFDDLNQLLLKHLQELLKLNNQMLLI